MRREFSPESPTRPPSSPSGRRWWDTRLPLTWIARGLRAALVYGDAPEAFLAAAVLLGMTLVLGIVGQWLFARFDRATRRRGLLEAF